MNSLGKILIVAGQSWIRQKIAKILENWADIESTRTLLDAHSLFLEHGTFDGVILDTTSYPFHDSHFISVTSRYKQPVSIASSELRWLALNYPHVPIIVLVKTGKSTWTLLDKGPGRIAVLSFDNVLRPNILTHQIYKLQQFQIFLVFPETASAGVSEAIEAVNNKNIRMRLGLLLQPDAKEVLRRCKSDCHPLVPAPSDACDEYCSSPKVCGLVTITGWEQKGRIIFFGSHREHWPIVFSSQGFQLALKGYQEKAKVMYLACQTALATGTSLEFHRNVKGCPMDFCFDQLDISAGLVKAQLCEECSNQLREHAHKCWLTPIQVEDVKHILADTRSSAGVTDAEPGGIKAQVDLKLANVSTTEVQLNKPLIENIARVATRVSAYFDEYSQSRRLIREHQSFILAMRHYNSDTPTIPGSRQLARRSNIKSPPHYVGGGYFLAYGGFGVAIDPGYDFLRLLYNTPPIHSKDKSIKSPGYTTEDIDLVIVTHNHLDHHADLETILRSKRGRMLSIFCTPEIQQEYGLDKRARHMQLHIIEETPQTNGVSNIILPQRMATAYEIKRLPALHWQHTDGLSIHPGSNNGMHRLQKHLNCFGLLISLLSLDHDEEEVSALKKLLITGDTLCPSISGNGIDMKSLHPYITPKHWPRLLMTRADWTQELVNRLAEAYKNFYSVYRQQSADLVCVHIGSIESSGWAQDSKHFNNLYDGHHLGLMGIVRLLCMMREMPQHVVVSEFGEELIGHRVHICDALESMLRAASSCHPHVIPADVALCIDLQNATIRCSYCDEWHPFKEIIAVEKGSDYLEYAPAMVTGTQHDTCDWRS